MVVEGLLITLRCLKYGGYISYMSCPSFSPRARVHAYAQHVSARTGQDHHTVGVPPLCSWQRVTAAARGPTHRMARVRSRHSPHVIDQPVRARQRYCSHCTSSSTPSFTTHLHLSTCTLSHHGPRPACAACGRTLYAAPGTGSTYFASSVRGVSSSSRAPRHCLRNLFRGTGVQSAGYTETTQCEEVMTGTATAAAAAAAASWLPPPPSPPPPPLPPSPPGV